VQHNGQNDYRSGIEVGHLRTDAVVGRNVHDHDRAPYLSHVHNYGKKMELNGSLECGKQHEPQEKGDEGCGVW